MQISYPHSQADVPVNDVSTKMTPKFLYSKISRRKKTTTDLYMGVSKNTDTVVYNGTPY